MSIKNRLYDLLYGDEVISKTILPILNGLGSPLLIGGAIRSAAIESYMGFSYEKPRDLDFVIYESDLDNFVKVMKRLGAKTNRYGGYSIDFKGWKCDVFRLEDTWARTRGLVSINEAQDFIKAPFFSCDQIAFDINKDKVYTSSQYFSNLRKRILHVNILATLNAEAQLIRAIRYKIKYDFTFGHPLKEFVKSNLLKFGLDRIIETEKRNFNVPLIQVGDC